mgnify:CR=1 FL=1
MQLTTTLRDLVLSQDTIAEISGIKNLSARMSYTFALVINAIRPHLVAYQTSIESMQEKYAEPDKDNPQVLRVKIEYRKQYAEEMDALLNTNVEILGIGQIPMSCLGEENIILSPVQLVSLLWLFKNDSIQDLFV